MQIPASDPKTAPCLSPRRTRPVAQEPLSPTSPVALRRQCQSQACKRATNISFSRSTLLPSPVREMGPRRIKLSTADLAALNRAILETPTSRGDDAPAALRRDPPWVPRPELCSPGQLFSVTKFTLPLLGAEAQSSRICEDESRGTQKFHDACIVGDGIPTPIWHCQQLKSLGG